MDIFKFVGTIHLSPGFSTTVAKSYKTWKRGSAGSRYLSFGGDFDICNLFARWGNLPYFDPEEHEIESGLLAMIPKQGSQSKNHLWFQPKRVPPSTNSLYSPFQSCGCRHIFLLFKHFPGPWGRDKFGKFGKQPSSSFWCAWIFMVQKNFYGFLIPKGFLFCHWVVEKISDFELTGAWPANKKPPGGKSLLFPSN